MCAAPSSTAGRACNGSTIRSSNHAHAAHLVHGGIGRALHQRCGLPVATCCSEPRRDLEREMASVHRSHLPNEADRRRQRFLRAIELSARDADACDVDERVMAIVQIARRIEPGQCLLVSVDRAAIIALRAANPPWAVSANTGSRGGPVARATASSSVQHAVNWQLQLVQGGTEAVLGSTSGSLGPYQTTRILDVFGSLGLSGDFTNVRAAVATGDDPEPAFIGFCSLETSSNGSADFRIAKTLTPPRRLRRRRLRRCRPPGTARLKRCWQARRGPSTWERRRRSRSLRQAP